MVSLISVTLALDPNNLWRGYVSRWRLAVHAARMEQETVTVCQSSSRYAEDGVFMVKDPPQSTCTGGVRPRFVIVS